MADDQEYLEIARHKNTGKWHITKSKLMTDALGEKSTVRIGVDTTPYDSIRAAELAASVEYKGIPFGNELT